MRFSDVVPLQAEDNRGLTGFYLVIGWMVGGYLMAALLGVAAGARPATTRRALIRILAVVPYAILSGLGGAVIVGPRCTDRPFPGALAFGALIVLGAATVTMAFQVLLGVVGIGAAVLLFVVLGNPSAGGAYQTPLLPPFWRGHLDRPAQRGRDRHGAAHRLFRGERHRRAHHRAGRLGREWIPRGSRRCSGPRTTGRRRPAGGCSRVGVASRSGPDP